MRGRALGRARGGQNRIALAKGRFVSPPPSPVASFAVPTHWSPELPVLEGLQAQRAAVWATCGLQAQQVWRDQLVPDRGLPDFDPVLPF